MFFKNQIKKALSLVLAIICALTCTAANCTAVLAGETTTAHQETTTMTEEQKKEEVRKKLEEQKALLDADLKNAESKIASLSAESKETEEYIDALDTKIGIMNKQLTLLDEQVVDLEADITTLQSGIDENQAQADALQQEVDKVQSALDGLNKKFAAKYDAYRIRMRAIYISGDYNLLTALLTCKDISGFLTRYEMIKAVSKNDAQLMKEIQEQTAQILQQESDLTQKKSELEDIKNSLLAQQNELKYKQTSLTQTQESIASKKITLAQDRAESDQLFATLTAKTGMYTEYRNEDAALTAAAEKQLNDLMNGVISADEVKDITTGSRSDNPNVSYNNTDVYANSDGVYNMTYPCPATTRFPQASRITATADTMAALIFRVRWAQRLLRRKRALWQAFKGLITAMAIMCLFITAQMQTAKRCLLFMPTTPQFLFRPANRFIKASR